MPKHLFFFVGRPSSGKETQATKLAEKLGYKILMTGKRFREIIASGSQLGNRIKDTYEKGLLMPTWVADYMLEDFLFNLAGEEGAVFEGSGRDLEQAKTIEKVCEWLGRPYSVINLEVPEEEVIRRAEGRGRDAADSADVMKNRLSEYNKSTGTAIEYFRSIGKLIAIDGTPSPTAVHEEVMTAVGRIVPQKVS